MQSAFCELIGSVADRPARCQAHAAIGQLFLDAERDADAVRAFTRALALKPDAFEARYGLATALMRLGKTREAGVQLELFERARRSCSRPAPPRYRQRRRARHGPPLKAPSGDSRPVAMILVIASRLVPLADTPLPQFVDITQQAGITFHHTNGASGDKHLVETMGSGGLFFDYDRDGWIDIFLVDGGSLADAAVARRAQHRLYRNRGDGTFEDVTDRSGIRHRDTAWAPAPATTTATGVPIST